MKSDGKFAISSNFHLFFFLHPKSIRNSPLSSDVQLLNAKPSNFRREGEEEKRNSTESSTQRLLAAALIDFGIFFRGRVDFRGFLDAKFWKIFTKIPQTLTHTHTQRQCQFQFQFFNF